jgi:hypothetical protein
MKTLPDREMPLPNVMFASCKQAVMKGVLLAARGGPVSTPVRPHTKRKNENS